MKRFDDQHSPARRASAILTRKGLLSSDHTSANDISNIKWYQWATILKLTWRAVTFMSSWNCIE